jgi:hypothetical protein
MAVAKLKHCLRDSVGTQTPVLNASLRRHRFRRTRWANSACLSVLLRFLCCSSQPECLLHLLRPLPQLRSPSLPNEACSILRFSLSNQFPCRVATMIAPLPHQGEFWLPAVSPDNKSLAQQSDWPNNGYSDRVVKGPVISILLSVRRNQCPHVQCILIHDPCYIELRHGSSANPIIHL